MFENALEIISRGGPVMLAILVVSIVAWTLAFLRYFATKRESAELLEFLWRLEGRLTANGVSSARELCWDSGLPVASIVAPLFSRSFVTKKLRQKTVQKAVDIERGFISRYLPLLSVFASVATFMGLLGTVLGMISSFDIVSMHGTGEPSLLARGVSQALITTEAGLVVALPLLLVHSYLNSRVETTMVEAHRKLLDISAGLVSVAYDDKRNSVFSINSTNSGISAVSDIIETHERSESHEGN